MFGASSWFSYKKSLKNGAWKHIYSFSLTEKFWVYVHRPLASHSAAACARFADERSMCIRMTDARGQAQTLHRLQSDDDFVKYQIKFALCTYNISRYSQKMCQKLWQTSSDISGNMRRGSLHECWVQRYSWDRASLQRCNPSLQMFK